jgi:acyl carrier protein
MSTNEERARKIVVEHLGIDAGKVEREADLVDDLEADSLDMIELVMAFEDEFAISIPDDELEGLRTFGDWVDAVDKKAKAIA